MKSRYLDKIDNIVKIKVEGKNINNFLKRIIKNKINYLKLIPISYKEVHLILKYQDYKKIIKYKSIYKITIIEKYGKIKLKEIIKNNYILLISFLLGIILLIIFSDLILSIDIIHEDKDIRNLLKEELYKNGIRKYKFKKNNKEIEKIEDIILNNNKEKLEWIEISESGTKYIVRVEERKKDDSSPNKEYQHIVSIKEAIITEINAISGEKVKEINDYVNKGEIIIKGFITLPDNTRIPIEADGEVFGEVWYKVNINYPYIYKEEIITGKSKTIYVLNFFNHRISLFDSPKYKSFKSKKKILLTNQLSTIQLIKEKQYELEIKDEVYPQDIAINKAKDYIIKKLKKDNNRIKKIKKITIISLEEKETTLDLKLFISTIENIGIPAKISQNNLETKE